MPPAIDDTGMQFIGGRRRRGRSEEPLTVTNPSNQEVLATDTLASAEDVDSAVAAAGSLINAGQDCTAATRAYVQRPLYDAFVDRVAALMSLVVVGAVDDPATDLGSLISFGHRDTVAGFVDRARIAGAEVVTGGRHGAGPLEAGAYYEPTLVVGAAQDSQIVQEEVFGPVLVALPFDGDDEGLLLANDTPYGLAASAWTSDVFRAQRAAAEIAAGCVWINDHIPIISEMPHGGYKASGFGKDMSTYSFEEYTQIKHVMSALSPRPRKPWHDVVFTGPAHEQGPSAGAEGPANPVM